MDLLRGAARASLYQQATGGITRGRLRAASLLLAQRLDGASAVLNLCDDRAAFSCGLLAAGLCGIPTLLPPARDEQTLQQLLRAHPGAAILADSEPTLSALYLDVATVLASAAADGERLQVDPDQVAVIAYTSGTTGKPKAVSKLWRSFAGVADRIASRFGEFESRPGVVATVPPQHMYGLECSVLMPLFHQWPVHRSRPFYPADIAASLGALSGPRVLVSTPVHLKALLNSEVRCPELAAVISATAPMPVELAAQLEAQLDAPCMEIYGCTETGAIASRRSIDGPVWTLFDGIRIRADEEGGVIQSDHLPLQEERLPDLLEVTDAEHFRLIGRPQDMINVAGRRYSVAELTRRILDISGVTDAVVLVPDASEGREPRPAAAVVAPGMDVRRLRAELGLRIDAVFLPRPLRLVNEIPRNTTGKVMREDLLALLQS